MAVPECRRCARYFSTTDAVYIENVSNLPCKPYIWRDDVHTYFPARRHTIDRADPLGDQVLAFPDTPARILISFVRDWM